jgi:hypothetical protein
VVHSIDNKKMNKYIYLIFSVILISCSNQSQNIVNSYKERVNIKTNDLIELLGNQKKYKGEKLLKLVNNLVQEQNNAIAENNASNYIAFCNETSHHINGKTTDLLYLNLLKKSKGLELEHTIFLQTSELIEEIKSNIFNQKIYFDKIDILTLPIDSLSTNDSLAKAIYIIGIPSTETNISLDNSPTKQRFNTHWGFIKNDSITSEVKVTFKLTDQYSKNFIKRIIKK